MLNSSVRGQARILVAIAVVVRDGMGVRLVLERTSRRVVKPLTPVLGFPRVRCSLQRKSMRSRRRPRIVY